MQKIAVFGGTFNPVHWGHLRIAEAAMSQKSLDQILWVTVCPRYKAATILEFRHRQAMVERAIAPYPSFRLCTLDAHQSNYAIDIIFLLQARYPNSEWYSIVGLDAFRSLPRWYRSLELAAQCYWLVAPRRDSEIEGKISLEKTLNYFVQQEVKVQWEYLKLPHIEVSSSLVRQQCHHSRSIHALVPETVRTYILEQGLY
ncbi:MAG: nicotinate (nicotinamide) nucleotide adenylyltransferase [Timaviella obliquedivisa GSE-PSE-MK23-08B]|jgi:nicotinate-nucleotide adenylyltransferase|nr:nicotinate (nicotinamide) nucleotide adenylyltransferase [Timaviella obliquedivisa GSE-PSE-MK23-08B]